MSVDVKSLTREELAEQFEKWGHPAYRVDQVLQWLYERRATSWDAMTNLPKALREQLRQGFTLTTLQLARKQGSRDTTQKFLWRLGDGSFIESVLIPANPALYGEASDRHTLCVSTQVGCAYGCRFCASGLDGWKRNLGVEEIVDQILAVERDAFGGNEAGRAVPGAQESKGTIERRAGDSAGDRLVNNLVIMGMGEPLANYDNLL